MTKQDRFLAQAALIANVILIAGGIASALFFAYACYRHGWTVLGFVGPALLTGLLFAAIRLKREYKINLVMVCVVLVLSVYAGEVILYLYVLEPAPYRRGQPVMTALQESENKQEEAARLAKEYGVAIDARDKLEVVTDLRSKGVDAVPSVIANTSDYQLRFYYNQGNTGSTGNAPPPLIALGGISNKLTVLCNENGQFVTYESDEYGFRNPKGVWQHRPVEIVALGDSFTQGYCVPSGKSFVDIIRQQHPATVNLGMAGEGPLLMLATLKEYAPSLRPKLVIWFYFEGNDFLDLQAEKKSALLMKYLDDGFSQALPQRQGEIDRVLVDLVEREKARIIALREHRIRLKKGRVARVALDIVQLRALRFELGLLRGTTDEDTTAASKARDLDLFRQILSRARVTVASWGGTLYLVYLPDPLRFKQPLPEESLHDKILMVARDLEIPTIDLLPAFNVHPDPMSLFPFRAAGHYTESGHRLVADEVLKGIAARVSQTPQGSGRTRQRPVPDADDHVGMSAKMARLLRDPDLASRLGTRAHQVLTARFQWEQRVKDYIAVDEGAGAVAPAAFDEAAMSETSSRATTTARR